MRDFAAELLGPVSDFQTAAAVNHVLGRLLVLLAANRIPPRNAGTIAYVCQLMLQSLPGVRTESREVQTYDSRMEKLDGLFDSLPELRPSLGSWKGGDAGP